MTDHLKNSLEKFEMLTTATNQTGLVAVKPILELDFSKFSPSEIIGIENAHRYKAHFIYFRKLNFDSSVPQVYIYDFTDKNDIDESSLIDLHVELYNSAQVPMFFVITKTDVIIFNCFDKPAVGRQLKYKPLEVIKLAAVVSEEIESEKKKFIAFSGKSFDNGSFWESSPYSSKFKFNNSAYEKLLTELKQALNDIISHKILPKIISREVMVMSILIKYLEERIDENGNSVFPPDFFNQFLEGANCFTDILHKRGASLQLFDYLAEHFNGGIFKIEAEARTILKEIDLSRFGKFLEGNLDGVQFVFWRLYSFNDLPIELISNIYEEFLGKEPGVVYTPPYLVNFLLDEAMPLSDVTTKFRVLDPACGSGVFLVGAYRRLVYRWRNKNNWNKPNLATLKKLLSENIYGVELNKEAANLTIFSLSLALCDELTPLQIWEQLKFENLHERNIINDDFFHVISKNKFEEKFDLIIGNPPFESSLTESAKRIELKSEKGRTIPSDYNNRDVKVSLPDKQIALLFLEQSLNVCNKEGLVCLIQPSGPFLYNSTSFHFRQYLLLNFNIPQIIDFTHISRILFGPNGDVATAAVFIKNENAKEKDLLHVTVRRTKPHKEKLFFEIDSYDFHRVPRRIALYDKLIWKANFLGGSRYHQLISRLSKFKTFGDFLNSKKAHGWKVSEGFTKATRKDIQKLESLKNSNDELKLKEFIKKLTASFLTGKKYLPTEGLTTSGIDESKIVDSLETKYFHSKGEALVYKAPHILIKELILNNSFPIDLSVIDLNFQRRIIGIHAPQNDIELLEGVKNKLKDNKIYPFYIAGTSGQYLINKSSAIYKKDIMNLPFPENEEELVTTDYENILIDDFNDYQLEFRRKGENSKVVQKDVSEKELLCFGEIYCNVLETVFKSIKIYGYFETTSFICYSFYFGDKPKIEFMDVDEAENNLFKLIDRKVGVNLRIIRNLRIYEGNVIYLIKPKKLRYWLRSVALRDADETFSELRKQGY